MKRNVFVGLVTFVLVFGVQNFASAIPCGFGGVSDSTGCQNGISNNDFPAPDTVNNEDFFGTLNWVYLSKYDVEENNLSEPFDVDWLVETTNGTVADDDGTWSFNSSVWSVYSEVMIVVKSGKHKTEDGDIFFSGYLLDSSLMPTTGTWNTGGKDLSHSTLYARGSGTGPPAPVPEPATMLLFGTGLVGLLGLRFRKKK